MATLKEIKEHYKDAEEVESIVEGKKGKISEMDDRGIHELLNAFWFTLNDGTQIMLFDNDNQEVGYAKILTKKKHEKRK